MKKQYKNLYKIEQIYSESVGYYKMGLKEFLDKLHKINKDAKKKGFEDITIEFEEEWGFYDEHWTNMVIKGKKEIKHVSEHLH